MKSWKSILSLLLGCATLTACKHVQPDRFFADARINDKPVRLAYDTGAEATVIFTGTARRTGLKEASHPSGKPPPGKVMFGRTESCQFSVGGETYRLKLFTVHIPWWWRLDVAGAIGWPDMIDDVIEINARTATVKGLKSLPEEEAGWSTLPLYPRTKTLALMLPRPDGKTGVALVDTGNPDGISLSPERWSQWKQEHPHAKWKWTMGVMPGTGLHIGRKYTADSLTLGPLTFTNVPIRKGNPSEASVASKPDIFEASIGFRALEQLNFVVDRKNNTAYTQPTPMLKMNPTNGPRKVPAPGTATNSTVHLKYRESQYLDCALDAFEAGKYDEAITNGEQFVILQPANADAAAWLGNVYYQAGALEVNHARLEQAVKELSRAAKLRPQWAEIYFVLGNIHLLLHQREEAIKAYRRFCELHPNDAAYAHFFIWLARVQLREKAEADAELANYLEQNKKTLVARQARIGNFLLGRLDEASFLREARARDFKHPDGTKCETWFYAGFKQQLAGNQAIARDYFQKCVATGMKEFVEYQFATAALKEANGQPTDIQAGRFTFFEPIE